MFLVVLLRFLVYCNTDCICNKSPNEARLNSSPQSLESSFPINLFSTLEKPSISQESILPIYIILNLKMSLNQVLRVWKYPTTQSIFFHHFFICLITSVNNCIDDWNRDNWVVHTIEESHETLVSDNFPEFIHHGKVRLKLHSNFKGVKNVSGYAISDSRKTAIEEIDCPVSHLYKLYRLL